MARSYKRGDTIRIIRLGKERRRKKRIRLLTSSSRPYTWSSKRDWEAIKPTLWAHYTGRVYHILYPQREGTYQVEYLQKIKIVLWVASYQSDKLIRPFQQDIVVRRPQLEHWIYVLLGYCQSLHIFRLSRFNGSDIARRDNRTTALEPSHSTVIELGKFRDTQSWRCTATDSNVSLSTTTCTWFIHTCAMKCSAPAGADG